MERCVDFAVQHLSDLMLEAFGYGSIIVIVSIMTGYVISKIQSLVTDK